MLGIGQSKKIAEMEARISALIAERDAVEADRDALAARVTALSARVKSLSAEVVRLRPYAGIIDAEREIERREQEAAEKIKQAAEKADQYIRDARATIFQEYEKLGDDREATKKEANKIMEAARHQADTILEESRQHADEIIRQAIDATMNKGALADAKRELRERERAEKAAERERERAERERVKAEKKAERERIKAEKQALRERERLERERRLAMRPSTIRFTYTDADFDQTTRTAEIKYMFDGPEGLYMRCFCHLRGDERTFRLDRIRGDIINVQTGELLKPWQLAALYDREY